MIIPTGAAMMATSTITYNVRRDPRDNAEDYVHIGIE